MFLLSYSRLTSSSLPLLQNRGESHSVSPLPFFFCFGDLPLVKRSAGGCIDYFTDTASVHSSAA